MVLPNKISIKCYSNQVRKVRCISVDSDLPREYPGPPVLYASPSRAAGPAPGLLAF